MSDTAVLQQAIAQFRNRNFATALPLFEQAGKRYGEELVAVNIELCRQALSDAGAANGPLQPLSADEAGLSTDPRPASRRTANSVAVAPADHTAGALDAATALMLHNGGDKLLDAAQRQSLIERYRAITSRRSQAVETKPVNAIPADWPDDLKLPPLPESTNDYAWNRRRKALVARPAAREPGLSIVVPTFNRSRILDVTLACLVNQKTSFDFEVIVADDGSRESIEAVVRRYEARLDIKYVRQKDYGYQLCAVRNLGLRAGRHDYVAILDCDMAPHPGWVQSYMELLIEDDDVALIGPRKYVDTSAYDGEKILQDPQVLEGLPQIRTNNEVAGKTDGAVSVDWRLEHFRQTDNLRLCDTPFRFFSGGNVAFARKWLDKAGWFDESFTHWGGEDNEFGYRLYRSGCFFRAVDGALAYHQEPPGKENETDRAEGKKVTIEIVREKVPYHYRKTEPVESACLHAVPLVSIYVPAFNCADNIVRCVDSALNQTVVDLEVCICDDGSTDETALIIRRHYGHNPRVRMLSQKNGGIGAASNAAVRMARGHYIGQLDSDDYLEPDAVELCLRAFAADRRLACVYTTNRNVRPDGSLIANGYNWPTYSREKLTTAMIVHHFRMFTARAWNLTSGFDEAITNAVDYDMYLKLSEVGPFAHVNRIAYNRVLHGENTSIRKLGQQKANHFKVVNRSLERQALSAQARYEPVNPADDACRKYRFTRVG